MTITSFNDFISAEASGYSAGDGFYRQIGTATTNVHASTLLNRQVFGVTNHAMIAYPSIPGGKSYFTPTLFEAAASRTNTLVFAKLTSMGSLNIATPTFTDGSVAPTITEGGTSRQIPSAILMVVTTGLNATPGNFTVTYQDQDGNTAETTASLALTASAVSGSASYVPLNGTDWGAIDITAATRTGGTTPSGVVEFFHVWPVAQVTIPSAGSLNASGINMLTDAVRLFKFANGDAISIIGQGTTVGGIWGRMRNIAL